MFWNTHMLPFLCRQYVVVVVKSNEPNFSFVLRLHHIDAHNKRIVSCCNVCTKIDEKGTPTAGSQLNYTYYAKQSTIKRTQKCIAYQTAQQLAPKQAAKEKFLFHKNCLDYYNLCSTKCDDVIPTFCSMLTKWLSSKQAPSDSIVP